MTRLPPPGDGRVPRRRERPQPAERYRGAGTHEYCAGAGWRIHAGRPGKASSWQRQPPRCTGRAARSVAAGGQHPGEQAADDHHGGDQDGDVDRILVAVAAGGVEAHRVGPSCAATAYRSSFLMSSSMLTSLKVTTRTLVTKRAGRYMSHTQASCSTRSKYTSVSWLRTCRS